MMLLNIFILLEFQQSADNNLFHISGPRGERIIMPFHQREVMFSSYFTCLNFEIFVRVYIYMTIQYIKHLYLTHPQSK